MNCFKNDVIENLFQQIENEMIINTFLNNLEHENIIDTFANKIENVRIEEFVPSSFTLVEKLLHRFNDDILNQIFKFVSSPTSALMKPYIDRYDEKVNVKQSLAINKKILHCLDHGIELSERTLNYKHTKNEYDRDALQGIIDESEFNAIFTQPFNKFAWGAIRWDKKEHYPT